MTPLWNQPDCGGAGPARPEWGRGGGATPRSFRAGPRKLLCKLGPRRFWNVVEAPVRAALPQADDNFGVFTFHGFWAPSPPGSEQARE